MVSVGTSIVPPGPCPPPEATPGASPAVTTPQVTASIHDFAGSLGPWGACSGWLTDLTTEMLSDMAMSTDISLLVVGGVTAALRVGEVGA